MISIENLSFKYKNSNEKVLDNISFEVNDGELTVIVGENGSGKSTIGKLISGILKLKTGNIYIDNTDIKKLKDLHDKVGIVFQNPETQIIFNNIKDEYSFGLKDKTNLDFKIDQVLEKVDMLKYKSKEIHKMSLGQKQRLVIGEVLIKNPNYLIFDEPTTMIDSAGKEKIYDIIKNLKKEGKTIICITNLAEEILIADKILILDNGKIVEVIKKEDLIEKIDLFEKYNIVIPSILKIISKLNDEGIKVNIDEYTPESLSKAIKNIVGENK